MKERKQGGEGRKLLSGDENEGSFIASIREELTESSDLKEVRDRAMPPKGEKSIIDANGCLYKIELHKVCKMNGVLLGCEKGLWRWGNPAKKASLGLARMGMQFPDRATRW